jgi:hypothetical protein
LTLVLLGLGGYVGYYDAEYARLSEALNADLGAYRRLRWEPPVLRGTPAEGNAADEVYTALVGFPDLDPKVREGIADKVHYGKPLSPDEAALVTQHKAVLDALRAATQHGSAQTELQPERGERMRVPQYTRVVDAALLLLARAGQAPADECLRATTEVIRIGQALVTGAPPEAASVSMRLTSLAAPVIARCVAKNDGVATRKAAQELLLLATHPPLTGSGIELLDLHTACKLRHRAALTNKAGPGDVLATIRERPMLLKAWAGHYADPTRFRKLTPDGYPDNVTEWKREQDTRMQSTLPFVGQDAAGVTDFLHDDMRGHALLRALAVGVGTLAERSLRGRLPSEPIGLKNPALFDPYRGQPLNFRVAGDGSELTLWSVGEDLRDDKGTGEWGADAPLDVTVRFPLK